MKLFTDIDKYKYCRYGIGFNGHETFSVASGFGKSCWSRYELFCECWHQKNIYFDSWWGPTQGLDDTTLTADKKYSMNFTESKKKFCLSLHYNGANSYFIC